MSISLRKVNNREVRPIQEKKIVDKRPFLGGDIVPYLYGTMLCLARKRSGKTRLMFELAKLLVGRKTMIIAFVGTLHQDAIWENIQEYFEEKGNPFKGYTSFYDTEGNDILERLMAVLDKQALKKKEKRKAQEKENRVEKVIIGVNEPEQEDEDDEPRGKYQEPEILFIFDDLSMELRSPQFVYFMKNMRHYKPKIIIGTQYIHDLEPSSLENIDIWMIFKGISEDKLEEIYIKTGITDISFENVLKVYRNATAEKYSFLYLDVGNEVFRKKLTHEYTLPKTLN
jgi:hypothetical protein